VRSHGAGYRAMNLQESMSAPEPSGPVTKAGESGPPAVGDKAPAVVVDRAANDPKEAAGTNALAARQDGGEDEAMAAGSDADEGEATTAESDADEGEATAAGSDAEEDEEMAAGSDADEGDEMAAESDADEDEATAAGSDADEDEEMAAGSDPDEDDEEMAAGPDPDEDEETAAGSDTDEEIAAAVIAAERAGTDAALAGAVDPDFRTLKRHHVSPAMIAIERIDDDGSFRVRHEGDISQLATDLARLGQLFPVDVRVKAPDRFQIICGFRRVAALRFLQRDRVLARLHTDLSDEDALLMALTSAIHAQPVTAKELVEVKQRLEAEGKLTPATRSMIEKALAPGDDLAPESVEGEEEVDADELAEQVAFKLGEINQDLSLLAGVFDSLDEAKRAELLEQLRYAADLVEFLEGKR
jgi:ParB family chromosome partitioning protein